MTTIAREGTTQRLGVTTIAAERIAATNGASEQFFADNAELIARACHAMAVRFQRDGRLLGHGSGAQRSDVAHVVVEFVHPVIVGKRALPAMALQSAVAGAEAETPQLLEVLGRSGDILLILQAGAASTDDHALVEQARARGMLTIALTGKGHAPNEALLPADFVFAVPSADPCIVQEIHETLYHMLWELVHIFFEHRAVTP